jgi:tRNA (cmo5U34)-methyltransferase
VLSAGAVAAQIGTAFMLAPEAGTSVAHRRALRSHTRTVLTRAFTGRLARGIANGFTAAHSDDAPVAYPELHYVTAPLRKRARETGDAELINLWAGEAHALALELPAAEIVARLTGSGQTADSAQVFNLGATDYNAARRRLVAPFDAFYGTAAEAVRLAGEPQRILDLGAGTGLLSTVLREAFPAVQLTLLDGAAQMLAQAHATLGDRDVRYREADLRDPLPDGPWDAVVSALAIHHLVDTDKQDLMTRIHAALRPGGVFVNAEQADGPSPYFTNLYATWHERRARAAGSDDAEWSAALERMSHDHCASVEDQLRWLREAGFRAVDCLFKQYRFAVIVALR